MKALALLSCNMHRRKLFEAEVSVRNYATMPINNAIFGGTIICYKLRKWCVNSVFSYSACFSLSVFHLMYFFLNTLLLSECCIHLWLDEVKVALASLAFLFILLCYIWKAYIRKSVQKVNKNQSCSFSLERCHTPASTTQAHMWSHAVTQIDELQSEWNRP